MRKEMQYESPKLEIIFIKSNDILTSSRNGFEGEEHSFYDEGAGTSWFQ